MTKVKICGVTTYDDALAAAQAGADMLGLNFYKKSPRYIDPDAGRTVCNQLRQELGAKCPLLVGVFVNEPVGKISITMEKVGLNFAQLSGDESGEMLRELKGIGYKAIRPRNQAEALGDVDYFHPFVSSNERIPTILLDAHHPDLYGGTGQQASIDVALAVKAKVARLMLAGGLTPDNVGAMVRQVHPWGVDVASGVEIDGQPGKKDLSKIKALIDAVRAVGV